MKIRKGSGFVTIFVRQMLKNILITAVAFIYLGITSGIAVNYHYCMGKIASVTFSHERDHDDGNCGKCGMNKTENHCCTDDVKFVKITDAHQSTQPATEFNTIDINILSYQINFTISSQGNSIEPFSVYSSPPPKTLNKVYLAVNTFLI